MSHYYEENWSFSGPIEDSQGQFDCPSTTELSPPLISSHDEKWTQNDSFEDDQEDILMHTNSYVNKNIKEEDKPKLLYHESILDDLIEDAILEVCFESHRIAKLCPPNGMNQFYDKKPKKSIFCYICKESKGYDKYSRHLCDCFSQLEGLAVHRKAKAKANYNFKETEFDDEDFEDIDDDERSERTKKGSRGKCKPPGNSLLKPSYNNSPKYEHMSFDEKKKFLDQKCGVVTKRSKKPCMNTPKCTVHSQVERDTVRHNFLRVKNDETDCIDVDTIDEESVILPSFGVGDGSTSILSSYFGSSAFP